MASEKTPAKRGRKKKVVPSKPAVAVPSELDDNQLSPLNKIETADIEKVIAQALVRHAAEEFKDSKDKLKEVGHISAMIEEYLSCFLLVGFSLQDEKVCVFNAKNSKDEAALVDHMRATFIEIINNRP